MTEIPYTLLLVDDEEDILRAMESYIKLHTTRFGRVLCAGNGQKALDIIFASQPDVMLLDVQMPGKTGIDVMREANAAGKCPKTIILSGYDTFAYAQKAMREGAADYLLKPCRSTEILEKLEALLPQAEEETEPREVIPGDENRFISHAIAYMRENLTQELSLTAVAAAAGISAAYLSALFTKTKGMTFVDYYQKMRVDWACDYLRDPRMKIYEIAYRVGFQSDKYFSRVFKKVTGKSPSEYRQELA
jgi:two-component system response regulator YesN